MRSDDISFAPLSVFMRAVVDLSGVPRGVLRVLEQLPAGMPLNADPALNCSSNG